MILVIGISDVEIVPAQYLVLFVSLIVLPFRNTENVSI